MFKYHIRERKLMAMLTKFITIAPMYHNYALCIDFAKHWFMEKFSPDFFSYIHLDGSHVFSEITKYKKEDIINHSDKDRGYLIIVPQLDESYNRNFLDMNYFGVDQFINTTSLDRAFFQDPVNKRYIMMKMDMTLMNFTFRIKMPSRAQQLDLFKYMKLAFRIGLAETKYINTDYLLPYPMMLSVAKDCGFTIENDRIKEPIKFLKYLNSRSYLPIIYKHSNVNGHDEYFVRMDHVPVLMNFTDISKDDGVKLGHLQDEFGIEMNISVRFPSMQLYIYYTESREKFIPRDKNVYAMDNTLVMALHQSDEPPAVNDKCWNLYIKTDYQADTLREPLVINMKDLFSGEELERLIGKHLDSFINPNLFMDIELFNDGRKINSHMDWDNMVLYADDYHLTKLISTIAIYVDLNYINDQRLERDRERTTNTPRIRPAHEEY